MHTLADHNEWQSINTAAYEGMSVKWLQNKAVSAGIANCCDMEAVAPYLNEHDAVLDVGTGFGRVLKWLYYKGVKNIYGIEVSNRFFNCTVNECPFAAVIQGDYLTYPVAMKFDVILLLWSFFMEFNKQDQCLLLKKSIAHLRHQGRIIIDIIEDIPEGYDCHEESILKAALCGNPHLGRLTSRTEIAHICKQYGFQIDMIIPYKTQTGKSRTLLILVSC